MGLKSASIALSLSLVCLVPKMGLAESLTLNSTDNGIYPYSFTVTNGNTTTTGVDLSCLNDTRTISIDETWDVTAINLKGLTGYVDSNQTSAFQLDEDAYLDSLYNTGFDGSNNNDVQKAIWDIQDTSDYHNLSSLEKTLVGDALNFATNNPDTSSFYAQFTVYIPSSTWEGGWNGEPQQFMQYTPAAATPEPTSLALLGTGLLGAVGMMRRKLQTA
jgi:hypothetical protein